MPLVYTKNYWDEASCGCAINLVPLTEPLYNLSKPSGMPLKPPGSTSTLLGYRNWRLVLCYPRERNANLNITTFHQSCNTQDVLLSEVPVLGNVDTAVYVFPSWTLPDPPCTEARYPLGDNATQQRSAIYPKYGLHQETTSSRNEEVMKW